MGAFGFCLRQRLRRDKSDFANGFDVTSLSSLKAATRQDGAIPLETPPLVEAKRKSRFIGAVGSFISMRTQCPMDNDASFFDQHTLRPPQRSYGIFPACKDRHRSRITVIRSDSYTRSFLEAHPGEPQFLILTFCSKGVGLA
jgi:hypothetical protein